MLKRILIICSLALVTPCAVFANGEVPDWLQQAATIKVPSYDKDIRAVVLLNEAQVTVSADGKVSHRAEFCRTHSRS